VGKQREYFWRGQWVTVKQLPFRAHLETLRMWANRLLEWRYR